MVKIKASALLAVDIEDIDFSNLGYAESVEVSSSSYVVDYGDGARDVFLGSGFRVNSLYLPEAGTVDTYRAEYLGTTYLSIEGLRLAATSIAKVAVTASGEDDLALILSQLKGDDTIVLSNLADRAYGGSGDDLIDGRSGRDVLRGNGGDDVLIGGAGADQLFGDTGRDTASYATATAGVVASLMDPGANRGNADGDTYSSIECLTGSDHADTLVGNGLSNTLKGGAGNDILVGGRGTDLLDGGAGRDVFRYLSVAEAIGDRLKAFVSGSDRLDFKAIDADTTAAGDQAFHLAGKTFGKDAGDLRIWTTDLAGTANDRTHVSGDVNGDGKADFTLSIDGLVSLKASDFLL